MEKAREPCSSGSHSLNCGWNSKTMTTSSSFSLKRGYVSCTAATLKLRGRFLNIKSEAAEYGGNWAGEGQLLKEKRCSSAAKGGLNVNEKGLHSGGTLSILNRLLTADNPFATTFIKHLSVVGH